MAQHSEPVPGGLGSPMDSQAGARELEHRPGMLTFAAVVMFMVAGFDAVSFDPGLRGNRLVGD